MLNARCRCSSVPSAAAGSSTPQARRPNVLLIVTDDQGYGDLGFHGNSRIRTPRLDALARESARFGSYYVSPVCSPTRSSLMTGRYLQDPWQVYEARRAAREVLWDLTALLEAVRSA